MAAIVTPPSSVNGDREPGVRKSARLAADKTISKSAAPKTAALKSRLKPAPKLATVAKTTAKVITKAATKAMESSLSRLQKRLFQALPGIAQQAPGIINDKGTFHPVYQLVGEPRAVNMKTLFDKNTGKIAQLHGRWRATESPLPFIQLDPKTKAGFRIDRAKMVLFAGQTVECPVNGCGFLNNVNSKDKMFQHMDSYHPVRPCPDCGDSCWGFMNATQRREHVHTKHRNLNNANAAAQQTKRAFSKFTKTTVPQLKGGMADNNGDDNGTIKKRLRSSTMSSSSKVAENLAKTSIAKIQAKAVKEQYQKAHHDEIHYYFCDRCQRNHIMLSTHEERQHHDALCVPGALPGRIWCHHCGETTYIDAEAAALNKGSFPHECPGSKDNLMVCALCGFSATGNFDSMKHHLNHCMGYGGEPAKFCPYCAKEFDAETSVEVRCSHIGICDSKPVEAIMATPMNMYPELFKGVTIRKRPAAVAAIAGIADSPRKRVQFDKQQAPSLVCPAKKTVRPPRPASTMPGMTSALADSSFSLAIRPKTKPKSFSPENPTFKAILAQDAAAPYAPIGTSTDLLASAATRKVDYATFNGPRRPKIDTDILRTPSIIDMINQASPITQNPADTQAMNNMVPRRLSPSVLNHSPPMVPSNKVFDTSDMMNVGREQEFDVSNIIFADDPEQLLANDPNFFGPRSPELDAEFVNAVTNQEYEPEPAAEPAAPTEPAANTMDDIEMLDFTDRATLHAFMAAGDPLDQDLVARALAAPLDPKINYFDEPEIQPIPAADVDMVAMGQTPELMLFKDDNATPTTANPLPTQQTHGIYGGVNNIQDLTQDLSAAYGSPVMNSAVMPISSAPVADAPVVDVPVATVAAAAMTGQPSRRRGRKPDPKPKSNRVAKNTCPASEAKAPKKNKRAAAGANALAAKAIQLYGAPSSVVDNGEGPSSAAGHKLTPFKGTLKSQSFEQYAMSMRVSAKAAARAQAPRAQAPAPATAPAPAPAPAGPARRVYLAGAIGSIGSDPNWRSAESNWPTEAQDFAIHKDLYCSRCLRPIPMQRAGKSSQREGDPSYAEQMAMHEDPERGCGIPHRIGTPDLDGVGLPNMSGWVDLSKKYDGKRLPIMLLRERFARDYPLYKSTMFPADGSGNRAALWANDPNNEAWAKAWNMPWPPYKGQGPIPNYVPPPSSVVDQDEIEEDTTDLNSAAGNTISVDGSYVPGAETANRDDLDEAALVQMALQTQAYMSTYGSMASLVSGPTNDDDVNDDDYDGSRNISSEGDDDSTIDEDWSNV